jgi:hypothetical protein
VSIFLFNFKKEFISRVESGEKRQTIRRIRKDKRRPIAGDMVKLYTGLRTRAARLLQAANVVECMSVRMHIDEGVIVIDGRKLEKDEAFAFAKADGFVCIDEMMCWFRDQYGTDDFEGFCVRWNPDTT